MKKKTCKRQQAAASGTPTYSPAKSRKRQQAAASGSKRQQAAASGIGAWRRDAQEPT